MLASVPGHPLWLKVLALMKERWQENPYREVVELTGGVHACRAVQLWFRLLFVLEQGAVAWDRL